MTGQVLELQQQSLDGSERNSAPVHGAATHQPVAIVPEVIKTAAETSARPQRSSRLKDVKRFPERRRADRKWCQTGISATTRARRKSSARRDSGGSSCHRCGASRQVADQPGKSRKSPRASLAGRKATSSGVGGISNGRRSDTCRPVHRWSGRRTALFLIMGDHAMVKLQPLLVAADHQQVLQDGVPRPTGRSSGAVGAGVSRA